MVVHDNKNLVRKLPSHRNLVMDVPMRKKCSNEEEKKNVRALGLPYLQMLQTGRRDEEEELVMAL